MALATIAGPDLTAALKPQLALLVDDMRIRLDADAERLAQWRATHLTAVQDNRTAATWTDWLEDQLTQAAVGWLLTSVFVRFCEDNLLLGESAVWIAGPTPALRQRAVDAENAFYRANQAYSYREWLEESFSALRANHATASLVDDHAALELMDPSSDAVAQILLFWRRADDSGELVWSFSDPELSTRFLGDLYQELSDYAKKKYALLQTPVFVEEFILDQTLEAALKDRPLVGFRLIDPTCGSGHFLLGAFDRLVKRWNIEAPGLEPRTRVNNALESIFGVDLNPFAVAIAKFRLIVGAVKAAGDQSLVHAPRLALNLTTGDSLLHGPDADGTDPFDYGDASMDKNARAAGFAYSTEDTAVLRRMLSPGQYDVVVGNPPYIKVKDKALNARYRELYPYCKGTYALTVPFMEQFFRLAKQGDRPGWIGQITSNSFMKREFGIPLIEEYLPGVDLQCVIDSEGVWIPGHNMDGTPTTILFGRHRAPASSVVRCVRSMGIREAPSDVLPEGFGPYWKSIVENLHNPGYEDQWISVLDQPRVELAKHPWNLGGGGVSDVVSAIKRCSILSVRDAIEIPIGRAIRAGADDAFIRPSRLPRFSAAPYRELVVGEEVRDWRVYNETAIFYPYVFGTSQLSISEPPGELWAWRSILRARRTFKGNMEDAGLKWWAYMQHTSSGYVTPLSICFSNTASHNHFELERGGRIFSSHAPIIKLQAQASIEDHYRLLGILNSSVACFWLRQHSQPKGGAADRSWSRTYEFTGATLQDFPLPKTMPLERARRIDDLARRLRSVDPWEVIKADRPTRRVLEAARAEHDSLLASMIAEQEEIDWESYWLFGLTGECLAVPSNEAPPIAIGERAFEIELARKVARGDTVTEWFEKNHAEPMTQIPRHWESPYSTMVSRRLETIDANPMIRLLEQPEYKRRWASSSWNEMSQSAVSGWLLNKLETPTLWFTPRGTPTPRSIGEIAGEVERDADFIEALDLWAGFKDAPVVDTLVTLLASEAVPYLAALRYKRAAMRKRAEWERTWALQRDEDAGLLSAADIPVPPTYVSGDFYKGSYWLHRGKLDVPKERFISYPDGGRATDPTPLLGWAGWDHAQQGLALATIYAARESEGAALQQLVPLVAGLDEVLPWVRQWHGGVDPALGVDMVEYLESRLQETSAKVQVPIDELKNWRPPASTRGRKSAVTKRKSGY